MGQIIWRLVRAFIIGIGIASIIIELHLPFLLAMCLATVLLYFTSEHYIKQQ